jgi:hypothetical protein
MSGQTVHLEPIVLQGRVYSDGEEYPGDYEAAFTVAITNNIAHISGYVGRISYGGYKDLLKKLENIGVSAIEFERIREGKLKARIHRQLGLRNRHNGTDSSY